jgi:homopolymeric O-antigen transport system ATP-binding protein
MSAPAVLFEHVSKRYPRGGGPRYSTLRSDLARVSARFNGRVLNRFSVYEGPLALDDISFRVEQGESFALVGPNGAGKTTALQLITRISPVTKGRVEVRGRVAALLQVSSGVHPELTGRENIWLFGRILGMSKSEVRKRFDEIVDFAELDDVLDRPVKMYSAGMQLRLGFSIASHLDPDVFVVDEALAVGDARFQTKCVERMTKLIAEGRTLLFVSHNLAAVEAICDRGIFLNAGKVVVEGSIKEVMHSYLEWVDTTKQKKLEEKKRIARTRFLTLEAVTFHAPDGAEQNSFRTGDPMEIRLRITANNPIRQPHISIGISEGGQRPLVLCSMLVDGKAPEKLEGTTTVACKIPSIPLMPRIYQLWCSVKSEVAAGNLLNWQTVGSFRVSSAPGLDGPAALTKASMGAPVYAPHEWAIEPTSNGNGNGSGFTEVTGVDAETYATARGLDPDHDEGFDPDAYNPAIQGT